MHRHAAGPSCCSRLVIQPERNPYHRCGWLVDFKGKLLISVCHLFVDRQRLLVWDETSAARAGVWRRWWTMKVSRMSSFVFWSRVLPILQLPAHEKIHQLRWSDTLNNAADLQLQINGTSVRWPQRHADFTIDTCTARQRRAAFVQRSAYPKDELGKKMLSFLKLFHCHSVEELQITSAIR